MCLHKQVWMSAFTLHILKCRWKRSTPACTQLGDMFLDDVQTIAFCLSPPKKTKRTPQWMLGKWFVHFTFPPFLTSKIEKPFFFLKPSQTQNSFSDQFSCLEGNIAAAVMCAKIGSYLVIFFLAALTFLLWIGVNTETAGAPQESVADKTSV